MGAEFVSPDQAHSALLFIPGFVHDVTNQVNILRNNNITIRQLLDVISKDSQ
jgi:hypothetical protein